MRKLLLRMASKYADKILDTLKRSRTAMLEVITEISTEAQPLLKKEKSVLLDEDIVFQRYWKRKLESKVEVIARSYTRRHEGAEKIGTLLISQHY